MCRAAEPRAGCVHPSILLPRKRSSRSGAFTAALPREHGNAPREQSHIRLCNACGVRRPGRGALCRTVERWCPPGRARDRRFSDRCAAHDFTSTTDPAVRHPGRTASTQPLILHSEATKRFLFSGQESLRVLRDLLVTFPSPDSLALQWRFCCIGPEWPRAFASC